MAEADLDRILARLASEGRDKLPLTENAERIEMLAANDLEKLRQTEDAGKIVSLVNEWHSSCKQARSAYERIWYKNLDMVQGRQFTEFDENQNRMVERPALQYEPRIAVNILEPIVRTEIAKTSSNQPTGSVLPASNDQADLLAALAGEQVWDWFYRDVAFQSMVFSPANWYRACTGNGFIKDFQNWGKPDRAATEAAMAEYRKAVAEREQMMPGEMLPPLMPPEPIMGALDAEPVTPFHLFVPDLTEVDIQKQPYLLHVYTMGAERARAVYAEYLPEGWQPVTVSADSVMNVAHIGVKNANQSKNDSVLVIEAWVKPGMSKLFPKGGLAIVIGDELVTMSKDGLPYAHGEYPFSHIGGIETGGFYRKSVVQSLIPLQNEFNRTMAQIIKHKNIAVNPMFFYDEGSVDPNRIRTKAGTYIPIKLGMKYPTAVPFAPLPATVGELLDRVKAVADDISGQHQVSRAISPGADTAASALAFLAETDDNYLTPTFDSIHHAVQAIARRVLSNAVQFWDLPRFIRITGADGSFDAKMLANADLVTGTDIYVDPESMLPKLKSARVATITEWMEKGFIPIDVGLEAMEAGTLGKLYNRVKLDQDQARRENAAFSKMVPEEIEMHYMQAQQAMMAAPPAVGPENPFAGLQDPALGIDIPPAPDAGLTAPADPAMAGDPAMGGQPMPPLFFPIGWMDNDAVHIEEHKAMAKSQSYLALPPPVQKELEMHVKAHEVRLSQQMMVQQQIDAAQDPAGAGGDPGYTGAEPQPATA